jgi:hypothetical protein
MFLVIGRGGISDPAGLVWKTWNGTDEKSPPFDFAQGRLSRKEREKWGTREK